MDCISDTSGMYAPRVHAQTVSCFETMECIVASGEYVEPFVAATTHPFHPLQGCMAIASLVPLHNMPFKATRTSYRKVVRYNMDVYLHLEAK